MAKMMLKKGDTVRVIAGKDKGKEGKILVVDKNAARVIVEGVNMITKHVKSQNGMQQGGIVHQEAPIHVSNVMYLHDGQPTRLGVKIEMKEVNGVMFICADYGNAKLRITPRRLRVLLQI